MEKNQKQIFLLSYVEPNNQRSKFLAFLSEDDLHEFVVSKLDKVMYQVMCIDLIENVEDSSETTDN